MRKCIKKVLKDIIFYNNGHVCQQTKIKSYQTMSKQSITALKDYTAYIYKNPSKLKL